MTSSWFDLGSTSKTLNLSLLWFNEWFGSENLGYDGFAGVDDEEAAWACRWWLLVALEGGDRSWWVRSQCFIWHGSVDDSCWWWFRCGLCDGVILLVGLAAWCWLLTLLFSIWQVDVVDLNFFFFFLGWNLCSLFLSKDGLIGGNCKDLMR